MSATSIEWTDHSVNPIRARDGNGHTGHFCVKVSPGCAHCYASRLQPRFGMPEFKGASAVSPAKPFLDESKLQEVLRRKKPTRYFWCDMTDLFGEWVPDEWIDRCFAVMALTPQHTHQVLTKRAERMADCLMSPGLHNRLELAADAILPGKGHPSFGGKHLLPSLPLSNVRVGFSAENQECFDRRAVQAAPLGRSGWTVFVSAEPLLGRILMQHEQLIGGVVRNWLGEGGIRWLIVGGESGQSARPCNVEWIRSLVRQGQAGGVAVFVKQLGARPVEQVKTGGLAIEVGPGASARVENVTVTRELPLRHPKGGDPAEWPADLRVREFPPPPPGE